MRSDGNKGWKAVGPIAWCWFLYCHAFMEDNDRVSRNQKRLHCTVDHPFYF